MIKCLPEEIQTSLRSGVAISSLGQCVEELVLNSIDAKATCVAVRMDLETFKVQVVDNGFGMGRENLNKVGNRYFTSKCFSVEDLENLKCYGFRGEALASIASVASILEISSKTNKVAKTLLKIFHNGKGLEVSETELNRPSAGTTVTVYNLFHQLPVRRKCMDSILEFEKVRHKVEALSLIHPSVSFSLRNDASCSMLLQLSKTKDTCSRFCQIYGLGKSQKLREINYKSAVFEISGFISSEGHYNKSIQFLYVNSRPVLKTRMHKLIDFLLRKQSSICKAKSGSLTSSPARQRSGPELHGAFVINVKCPHDEYDVCLEPAKTLIEFRCWDALLACIEEGVKEFLKREHLFIELCGEDIKEFNEKNGFCLVKTEYLQPSLPEEKDMQESFKKACDNIVDSYEIFNLQSKSVRRKRTLAKMTPDHVGPTNNLEGTDVGSGLTGIEPVHELSSSKVENLLPNKIGSIDLQKLGSLHQESNIPVNLPAEVMNSNCSEEISVQDRSVVSAIDKYAGTSLCTEKYDKDANSLQDRDFQESIPNAVTLGYTEAMEDVNEFKGEFPFGHGLMGKYKLVKDSRVPSLLSNASGEVMGHEQLKLGSTGLITHLMQNLPPRETEINISFNRLSKVGPISAKAIFEKKLRFSEQTQSSQEHLRLTNTATGNECMEKGNVSGQKNEVASFPANGSANFVMSHVKECISMSPSGSVHHLGSATRNKQIAELSAMPRYCGFTKLSLHPKLGSLDRFRRHYGSIKSIPPITNVEKRNEVEMPGSGRSPTDENADHQHSSICETATKEHVVSNHTGHNCLLSLEKPQHSTEENLLSRKAFHGKESPPLLTDYSEIKKKSLSGTKFTGTLASKVSRMKNSLKEMLIIEPIGQPSEQFQAHSSQKDGDRQDRLSQNKLSQSASQIPQISPRRVGTESFCFASACDEENNPVGISSTRLGDVEDTDNHCFIDTDGEYIDSQNRSLALFNKEVDSEGSCENTGIMGRTTEQATKPCELQNVNLTSNMEDADDLRASEKEESQLHLSEWLHQFDTSLGRTVYINKMTGLSTYIAPRSEEPQAVCTKDISTMAVNVMEGDSQGESLQSLFSEWDNPVFAHFPEVAVDVSSGQADSLAVKIHNILYPYRFTKKMIDSMQVLNQVDNKFIACLINTRADENEDTGGNLLVLVDQHAAHERVRLEQLITDSYEKQPEALGKKKLLASTVCPPLEIEITEEQRRLLWRCHKSLEDVGLELSFPENNPSQILIGKVPLCFVEREANELRRGRQTVTKGIVQEFIREQIELLQTMGGARGTLPLTILKVLASQACHGAVKFNDHLTLEESCHLMEALSCCQLPFQCAHGRPSMLPLADVDHLQQESQPKPNLDKLRRMAKRWQLFRKEKDCYT
ncbi:DNA mismatch repair protein Mlh3 isoform X2 [Rhineura floridana]|uniref:DNA mismatch repair protein Mlh3 isoform X2 n=1 Tax=Rhineura floridana TaxID=261503 RepID=UPI002AC86C4D|nr:DNA mismatch repair protein Mlh3 isoform X2 [Rhineura floridana]